MIYRVNNGMSYKIVSRWYFELLVALGKSDKYLAEPLPNGKVRLTFWEYRR